MLPPVTVLNRSPSGSIPPPPMGERKRRVPWNSEKWAESKQEHGASGKCRERKKIEKKDADLEPPLPCQDV